MYSVAGFERMIDDALRMSPYAEALQRTIKPGMAVADLGAGSGIFSLLACRFGARRVYAVEPNDALEVARMHARANGFGDRIEFFSDLSTRIDLPEKVDVIVSDMRGAVPPHGSHFLAIADARRRFLRSDGVLIPSRDRLFAAVVGEAPAEKPDWDRSPYGLDFSAVAPILANTLRQERQSALTPERLLTESGVWCELDYTRLESADCCGSASLAVTQPGVVDGLAIWFVAELIEGVGFSTGPGQPNSVYGVMVFPAPKGLTLASGERVDVEIRALHDGDGYVWYWNTTVYGSDGAVRKTLKQSTFFSQPMAPRRLRKRADSYVPAANERGRVERFVLERFDTGKTLGAIAHELVEAFPRRFSSWQEALSAAGDVATRLSD